MHHGIALRVRYAETDQMGVAYHTHYLVWCEIGRTEFLRALGTSYAELERAGLLLAVADARIRFLAAARYDDLVRVETRVDRVQSRTITFAYELLRQHPDPSIRLATATTTLIALDEAGVTRTLPRDLRQRFRDALATAT